jgi:polyphosphate glucokinase
MIQGKRLLILGGGISKEWDEFSPSIKCSVPIVPAVLQNQAGIIGAAAAAYLRDFPELIREGI